MNRSSLIPIRIIGPIRRAALAIVVALTAACNGDGTAEAAPAGESAAGSDSTAGAERTERSLSLPVTGEEVRDGDLVLSVVTTGQVRSEAEARLTSDVSGIVDAVLVRPGDRVRRGQALVRLDPRPFDLAIREADAAVEEAELRYRDDLIPDSVATGRAPTEERRRYALTRSGLITARVRLDRARLERERATMIAPFGGIVDRVDVAVGERLQPGQTVTKLIDLDNLRIEASVLEHDIALVRVGGMATVTSAAAADRPVHGRVTAVLPLIDSTSRAGRAYIRAPSGGVLRPGMYADVRLETVRLPNCRLVPARAVIERDGRPLVFVVRDGRAQWTYITPGRSNGVDTEVLPDSATGAMPLEPGDMVIVEGHLTLTHEAPVRLMQDAARRTRGAGPAP